jgi:spermidine synthase
MNEHGVLVDIVEIDPLVYKYANEYFGLHRLRLEKNGPGVGQDGGIWLEDARGWVDRYSGNASPPQYNYIVHDVFSGGSVAGHLFSVEFWDELKKLLRADGVLAVVSICDPWFRWALTDL